MGNNMTFSEEELYAIADAIYARRCDEHVKVLHDCPNHALGNNDFLGLDCRPIPPYCGEYCDLMKEPTAYKKMV